MRSKRFTDARKILEALGARKNQKEEAKRFFHLARAYAGLRDYKKAEQLNSRAFMLNTKMISAIYNNACYTSLARNKGKSIQYLNMLADALKNHNRCKLQHYIRMLQDDVDLNFIRNGKDFKNVMQRVRFAH